MQFEIRNAKPVDGAYTETGHCAHNSYTMGYYVDRLLPENEATAKEMRDNYGMFFRTGTFPEGFLKTFEDLGNDTNIIRSSGLVFEEVYMAECQVLDKLDNYMGDKWAFEEGLIEFIFLQLF